MVKRPAKSPQEPGGPQFALLNAAVERLAVRDDKPEYLTPSPYIHFGRDKVTLGWGRGIADTEWVQMLNQLTDFYRWVVGRCGGKEKQFFKTDSKQHVELFKDSNYKATIEVTNGGRIVYEPSLGMITCNTSSGETMLDRKSGLLFIRADGQYYTIKLKTPAGKP